jgi:hypothetical protein
MGILVAPDRATMVAAARHLVAAVRESLASGPTGSESWEFR